MLVTKHVCQPSGRRAPQLAEPLRDVVDIREREELGLACVQGADAAQLVGLGVVHVDLQT